MGLPEGREGEEDVTSGGNASTHHDFASKSMFVLQGDLNLNICEAHAFNTHDRFSLDVFVVNGWSGEVTTPSDLRSSRGGLYRGVMPDERFASGRGNGCSCGRRRCYGGESMASTGEPRTWRTCTPWIGDEDGNWGFGGHPKIDYEYRRAASAGEKGVRWALRVMCVGGGA